MTYKRRDIFSYPNVFLCFKTFIKFIRIYVCMYFETSKKNNKINKINCKFFFVFKRIS